MNLLALLRPTTGLAAAAIVLSLALPLTAQTWDRGAATESWGTPENWDPDGAPLNDGTASVVFDTTGAGLVDLGGVTRNLTNVTLQGTAGYNFAAGVFSLTGVFTNNATGGTQQFNTGVELQGTGGLRLTRSLRFGEFGGWGARSNTFGGGTVLTGAAAAILQYGGFTGGSFQYLLGTGAIQMGAGTLNTTGGVLSYNATASGRMTISNHVVNAITRDNNFGSNQLEIRYDGGLSEATATTSRLTGDFTTAALDGGATGHGWTVLRGRAITDGSRQFSAATYELSGDWTGYAPVSSKLSLMQAAFVLENSASVANHNYTLNANNAAAQSTVLALGDGFGANTFNRAITIEVGATGNSNAAGAVNQTYIGGRQDAATTAGYSGNITFNNTNAHRLNLFSEDGRTEFSGNLSAGTDQVVAINSDYSMTTHTGVDASGLTTGNAFTAMTPDGVVAFTGGTKTFAGGLQHLRGTLLINQTITGNVTVAAGAQLGTDGLSGGTITGDLGFASGAKLLLADATLDVTGTTFFAGAFGVLDVVGLDNTTVVGTYTLIGGDVNFANITNVGLENAVDLGNGVSAYFQQDGLQLVVAGAIPEPAAFAALAGLGMLGFAAARRRRRA